MVDETECFFFRWDKFPVTLGHLLVIPKRHVEFIRDLSAKEGATLTDAIKFGMEIVKREVGPDGFNVGVNDGATAGQTVPHVHVHIIPRRMGDVPDPRGGVRGIMPGKARY